MKTAIGEAGAPVPTSQVEDTSFLARGAAAGIEGTAATVGATSKSSQSAYPNNSAAGPGGGVPPPAWPTGISNTTSDSRLAMCNDAKTAGSRPLHAAQQPAIERSAAPTVASAARGGATSSVSGGGNGGAAGEVPGVTAGNDPTVVYSAENLIKVFGHVQNSLTVEQLQRMTLPERSKYGNEMAHAQQQQQVIKTLREKATTVEVKKMVVYIFSIFP